LKAPHDPLKALRDPPRGLHVGCQPSAHDMLHRLMPVEHLLSATMTVDTMYTATCAHDSKCTTTRACQYGIEMCDALLGLGCEAAVD
jgi:hypothetical protein